MEYSATETYANRYDLDKIDVFLEGDSNNPMYFSIDGLSKPLALGKHYFYLSILNSEKQDHRLKSNSRILFEFKSSNNVVLKSDVTKVNQRNGVISGYVEILKNPLRTFKEVEDGEGTLTIVGSLENKSITENLIPEKFEGAMNYRCIFPINIRKNLINADSPSITAVEHSISTIPGQFSFIKNNISPPPNADGGTYDPYGNLTTVGNIHGGTTT